MDYKDIVTLGTEFGYEGEALQSYVEKREEIEGKKNEEQILRDERQREREEKKIELESKKKKDRKKWNYKKRNLHMRER